MEIMPDHVHILLGVDPQFGIHKAVKTIKGTTSRILRQEFPWLRSRIPTLWTKSYFCSTIGGAPLSVIITIFNFVKDNPNNIPSLFVMAYLAAESIPEFIFTKKKKYSIVYYSH